MLLDALLHCFALLRRACWPALEECYGCDHFHVCCYWQQKGRLSAVAGILQVQVLLVSKQPTNLPTGYGRQCHVVWVLKDTNYISFK
jgi:hypothetical protein